MNQLQQFFKRGGPQQQQQAPPPPPSQSWYPPSVVGTSSSGSPRLGPPPPGFGNLGLGSQASSRVSSSSSLNDGRPVHPQNSLPGSSSSITSLKDKSAEELNRLLNDKDAYNKFLHSLDEVRRLEKISDELRRSTIDESRSNLAKESEISELRTQCMIIRNTELAASQEKFDEFEKRYKEVQANCSTNALFGKLQDAANEADEESENYHRKFLNGEIELLEYIQKYRKQRVLYHKRSLIRMAALTSLTTPG